ncbi:putative sensor protein [Halanaerobium sp. ST460_2HS_T2]|nr:putative sensor protein [Halanaerobium sp. ST460_2HS_T2]
MFRINSYFKVLMEKQTYKNILYLLLSFPLGIFYFVFLMTGLTLGFGLIVILVGIPILFIILILSRILVNFEISILNNLLNTNINPLAIYEYEEVNIFQKVKKQLSNSVTWKGIIYLFLRFPLGIFSFTITISLLSVSLVFLSAPLTYQFSYISFGNYQINNLFTALLMSFVGIILTIISTNILNHLTFLIKKYSNEFL